MRKEKAISPKDLLQKAREAEYNKSFIEKLLANNDAETTLSDLTEAQERLKAAKAALDALPPPPVLPPRGQLEKITGRLEEFSRIRCKADFEPDFYTNHPNHQMSSGEKTGIGAAAIAFDSPALAGLALKEEQPMTSEADYIKGMINGKPFTGWVGLTHLKVGDEVELAAEWQDDHYQVYAITLPAERMISVCPRANHGSYIQAKLKLKHTIWFLTFMLVLIQGIYISLADGPFLQNVFDSLVNNKDRFYLYAAIQTAVGVPIIGVIFYSMYLGYVKTSCALAENVFRAFGWENPKGIDLEALTLNREKELKRSGEWYSPDDNSKPPRPTMKGLGYMEYWYYY
ncbi:MULTISPECIES: putative type VI secretion system effector [Pantoea]|uniref:Uncharacterized protein n=2 Tax=Pantoea TaxID=53335 RepID=A0A0U3UBA7_9GAMM|nr:MULTISPECIES: putative type VI secretion system effector [Pantoea]ALV93507.1 hypothetical protein LK04_15725 [Pantoea vagans]KHJ68847.1 hypothetical protein QU24_06800 [Pantoea rodasii]